MGISEVLANQATWHVEQGDVFSVLKQMPSDSVQVVCTSPPYWALRSYLGKDDPLKQYELGSERTPAEYVERMVAVFNEVRRVLRQDGTCWLNIGDSHAGSMKGYSPNGNVYAVPIQRNNVGSMGLPPSRAGDVGLKPKNLCLIPQRLSIALQDSGWWVRSWITWCKRAPMPESVTDRPTSATEVILLLTKSEKYYYDNEAVKEPTSDATAAWMLRGVSDSHKNVNGAPGQKPHSMHQPRPNTNTRGGGFSRAYAEAQPEHGAMTLERPINADTGLRNQWNYWLLGPEPQAINHYACFPSEIPRRAVKAGSRPGDLVLDPCAGSGTTLSVAVQLGRRALGIELSPEYVALAERRMNREAAGWQSTFEEVEIA